MSPTKLQINDQSLRTELKAYKNEPLKAIGEYVWNAFDARATRVDIDFTIPEERIGRIDAITIRDNGTWWDFDGKDTGFFLSSGKQEEEHSTTLPHGRWWRGRYSFIWFAERLEAESIEKKMVLKKDGSIEQGASEIRKGTTVSLIGLTDEFWQYLFDETAIKSFLWNEFAWFIKGDSRLEIYVNSEKMDFSFMIKEEISIKRSDLSEELQEWLGSHWLEASLVIWDKKPREFSRFYVYDKTWTSELFTKTTGLNKQGDEFWHSAYVYSSLFTKDDSGDIDESWPQTSLEIQAEGKIKKRIFAELKTRLCDIRRPILTKKSKAVVKDLHVTKSIPDLPEYGIYDTEWFDEFLWQAYVIAPGLFVWKWEQERKFICGTFAAMLSSQDGFMVMKLLEHAAWMDEEDKKRLMELMERTHLSCIVRTASEIQYRLDVVSDLESLLFSHEKETLEVKHLQQVLNANPWVFWEQFRLFVDTEWPLKSTLFKYAKEVLWIDNPEIESESKKELDLFLVKTLSETETVRRNIIVEIKRPSITLHKEQRDQIELYAKQILQESVCNDPNTYWEFFLIGNDYDADIVEAIDNARNHGEWHRGLISNTLDGRKKIYVRKWSDILGVEIKNKMKYLEEKLNIKHQTADSNPDKIAKKYISN